MRRPKAAILYLIYLILSMYSYFFHKFNGYHKYYILFTEKKQAILINRLFIQACEITTPISN